MKKIPLILYFCTIVFLQTRASNGTVQSAVNIIDFSSSHNLKAIFDAGLRPWRAQGLESSNCMLGQENLKFLLPAGDDFSVLAQKANIEILAGNEIYRIDVTCNPMTLDDAVKQAKNLCQQLEIPTRTWDDFLASLGNGSPVNSQWGADKKKDGVYVQVHLLLIPSRNGPAAQNSIVIEWPMPDEQMKFLTEPIKPPPGYENVSMAPPVKPLQNTSGPNNNPTQSTGAYQQQQGSIDTMSVPAHSGNQSRSSQSQSKTSSNESSSRDSWLTPKFGLWALVLIAAAMLGFYIIRKK